MDTIYGRFSDQQLKDYKVKLHKEVFWLLLYKDPETKDKYQNVDFEQYFYNLMLEIDGLNTLLFYPYQIVRMMSILQAALKETRRKKFRYWLYRKLILDTHRLIDETWEVLENGL